jgi:hypothetical protein
VSDCDVVSAKRRTPLEVTISSRAREPSREQRLALLSLGTFTSVRFGKSQTIATSSIARRRRHRTGLDGGDGIDKKNAGGAWH